jgi:hypothetical protein
MHAIMYDISPMKEAAFWTRRYNLYAVVGKNADEHLLEMQANWRARYPDEAILRVGYKEVTDTVSLDDYIRQMASKYRHSHTCIAGNEGFGLIVFAGSDIVWAQKLLKEEHFTLDKCIDTGQC